MKKSRVWQAAAVMCIVIAISSAVTFLAGTQYTMASASSTLYSLNGELNLRAEPRHDSGLVTTIYGSTPMYYDGETGQGYGSDGLLHIWYRVRLDSGVTGWVRSDLVSAGGGVIYYGSSQPSIFYSLNGELNVRALPAHDSSLIATVYGYTPMYYTGETGQGYGSDGLLHIWYRIRLDSGVTGWVRSDLVYSVVAYHVPQSGALYSLNGELNLRSEPYHDSGLVTTIYGMTPMYFTGETGQGYGSDGMVHVWYRVRLDSGVTGWVRSDLVYSGNTGVYLPDPSWTAVMYSINGELNLRAEPRHNSALVTTVYGITPMYYTGETGQGYGSDGLLHIWYRVRLDSGVTGWVRSDLVR